MQYQKLTNEQKSIRRWRLRRNHLVCKIMDERGVPAWYALQLANEQLRKNKKGVNSRCRSPQPTPQQMTGSQPLPETPS